MQAIFAKSLSQYRLHARRLQALQRVVLSVLPESMHTNVQVASFRDRRVCIQIDNAVLLLPLRGLQSRLLQGVRSVSSTIDTVDFVVRPLSSMPVSPRHLYQQSLRRGPAQCLSVLAQKQMTALAKRCQNRRLQASLERMLRRYRTSGM